MEKKKTLITGFLIGFLGTFLMILLPFFISVDAASNVFLFPARQILSPLNEFMADWPGLVNVLLAALANGVVYSLVFWIATRLFK